MQYTQVADILANIGYRRLSKDYEHSLISSEAWIYITAIHRMARAAMPDPDRDNYLLKRPKRKRKT